MSKVPKVSRFRRSGAQDATIAALLDRREQAVALFKEALAEGWPVMWAHYDRAFYPPFQELTRPKE